MAQVFDDADFWLSPPPHFLSDHPPLYKTVNKAVGGVWKSTEADSKLAFPRQEFLYEFGALKSEVGSPVDSTGSEEEEEEFFAELSRRLTLTESRNVAPLDLVQPSSEVPKAFGGSPQSILGGIGSWSGRSSNESNRSPLQGPSPPATPYQAEYGSAGQLESFKLFTESPLSTPVNGQFRAVSNTKSEMNHMNPVENHSSSFLAEQNYLAAARRAYNAALLYEHQLQKLKNSAGYAKTMSSVSSHCLSLQLAQQQLSRVSAKPNVQAAVVKRKESVGTGVFLPRRYNQSPAAPPRKRAVTTNAIVPPKVVQALNISLEEIKARTQQPHYSAYAASMSHQNYELLMARRNAFLLTQQQGRIARADDLVQSNIEVCLPQEWSY